MRALIPNRLLFLTVSLALLSTPSSAQITVLDTFNPSQTGGLCGLGFDPATATVWAHACSGATIDGYAADGTFLASLSRPGESANDVDVEIAPEDFTLAATPIPAGTPLFINGESGPAEIYAIDPGTGDVLDTLATEFGVSHVVGGGFDPNRGTFFLIQDRVPSGTDANRIAEVDPITGAVLNSFLITPDYDVNFGDLDVSTVTGHLFLVSSNQSSIGEFTPTGDFVTTHALPTGVSSLSGIALNCAAQEAWVANTSGAVWLLGDVPCGPGTDAEETVALGFTLDASYPNPFVSQTTIRFTLPHASPVRLAVYDVRGALVRTLADGPMPAGTHAAVWDGTDHNDRPVASGAYFYRLSADGVTVARSMVRVR